MECSIHVISDPFLQTHKYENELCRIIVMLLTTVARINNIMLGKESLLTNVVFH